jgi:hypothetical protein
MKMTNEQADKYLKDILSTVENTLGVKAKEYVRNEDRMHNFNQGATKLGQSRERVLRGFRLKHDISSDDLLDDLDNGILPTKEYAMEKYGDIINYNILELMSILHKIELKNGIKHE